MITKTIKFLDEADIMEIGERLQLKEIEEASSRFKACPKCKSAEGFWLGLKRERAYAQCKSCGTKFELLQIYLESKKDRAPKRIGFIR
jgi:transcription elongation factor Elf1